ncbi:hypothetical protein [Mycoplasma sp. HU2014]|uniref:hypothetical protein n=1 Tax=Mycoplasma sp. HU2014 TaxID=1664275 RepID=UPI001F34A532|nr:hypothetical protein [Mycoplasma sp. HU2014]
MASHKAGASCHSSIILGYSPSRTNSGLKLASFLLAKFLYGLPTKNSLFELCLEVHVLPHHLGPSTQIAPAIDKYRWITSRFIIIVSHIYLLFDIFTKFRIKILPNLLNLFYQIQDKNFTKLDESGISNKMIPYQLYVLDPKHIIGKGG